jgi:pyruvate/2-oxoglutarate dehydrogenase complex dihydrolipoamide acyltransferase (E2) component
MLEIETGAQDYHDKRIKSIISLTDASRTKAESFRQSLRKTAQLTLMCELDMTGVVKLLGCPIPQSQSLARQITYSGLVIASVAKLLSKHNLFNASLIGNEIHIWEDIDIAVKFVHKDRLLTTIIRSADNRTLDEIDHEIDKLYSGAKEGAIIKPKEDSSGTFTIIFAGELDMRYCFETVIVEQPQLATLRIGALIDRVIAREGQIAICPMVPCSFSYDHRVLDGATGAEFSNDLAKLILNPSCLLDNNRSV